MSGQTKLLISVRNPAEALAALDGGADIIDVKEPSRGPLGMADVRTIDAIVAAVRRRAPVSAALGELLDDPAIESLPQGVAYAKVGLAKTLGRPWRKQLARLFERVPHIRPIAVGYADGEWRQNEIRAPRIKDVIRWAADHGAAGVLIDTAVKNGRSLFGVSQKGAWREPVENMQYKKIRACVQATRSHGLMIALAGSLAGESLARAIELGPDIIAVRGAACVGGKRTSRIDSRRVRQLADLIAARNAQLALTAG